MLVQLHLLHGSDAVRRDRGEGKVGEGRRGEERRGEGRREECE